MAGSKVFLAICTFMFLFSVVWLVDYAAEALGKDLIPGMQTYENATTSWANSGQSQEIGSSCQPLSDGFPQSITQWKDRIETYSCKRGISADLTAGVVWRESNGKQYARSYQDAAGLMQVMAKDSIDSGTGTIFMCNTGPCFADRPTVAELFDPDINFDWGTKILAQYTNQFGLDAGLKAYCGGDALYANEVICLSRKKDWSSCVHR